MSQRTHVIVASMVALALSLLVACDGVPVAGLEKSFSMVVDKTTGDDEPVRIDFLWVIDNSTSMCEEQINLTASFETFISAIRTFTDFDARVGVVTMDVQCDPDNPLIDAAQGQFNENPATIFPPSCYAKQVRACTSDADCDALDCEINPDTCGQAQGEWFCRKALTPSCMETPNYSLTTECVRRCGGDADNPASHDAECADVFGDPRYYCHKPSTSQADWGCMLPPLTKGLTCGQSGVDETTCACTGTCSARQIYSCPIDFETTRENCPDGSYRQVHFGCCPGDLSTDDDRPPCISEIHRDDETCHSRSDWINIASEACSAQGLALVEEAASQLPGVLESGQLGLFSCLATVGVNQNKCFQYEQGMRSARLALDPNGPNADQARDFLRDDAYLVIVFVSDEDDCSTGDGLDINEDYHDTCAFQPTLEQGGALVPVGHYVNIFKSLKDDPARVIVAAIAGDAVLPEAADQAPWEQELVEALFADPANPTADEVEAFKQAKRDMFVEAKSDPKLCYHESYVCLSDAGIADWGARYQALTQGFGKNGIFQNVCNPEGIEPALATIADRIIQVISKVCLPRPVQGDVSSVLVQKWTNLCDGNDDCADGFTCGLQGETRRCNAALTSAADPQAMGSLEFALVTGGVECSDALIFGEPPGSGQQITINYQADPGFGD